MNLVTVRLLHAQDGYLLFRSLQHHDVAKAIADGGIGGGTKIIIQTILRDLVVALAAMFDHDNGATNIRRYVNVLVRPANRDTLRSFHETWTTPPDTDAEVEKLRSLKAGLFGNPSVEKSIERIRDLRHQVIAHVDLDPEFPHGTPQVLEVARVLVAAARVAIQFNYVAFGRSIDWRGHMMASKRGAEAFSAAIKRGARPSAGA